MVLTGRVTRELEIWTKSERLEYEIYCCIVSNKKEVESTTTNYQHKLSFQHTRFNTLIFITGNIYPCC
jgi:hypothetical protein